MIVSIWVFFMVGDSLIAGEPPAYEQQVVSGIAHDRAPECIEAACVRDFHVKHPHHVICDSGWCRQEVKVMGE